MSDADKALAAPEADDQQDEMSSPSAASDSELPAEESDGPAPATADEDKKRLRDVLSERGRELAEAKRRAEMAERLSVHLAKRLSELEQYISAKHQQEVASYLQSLPPEQQLAERLRLLEERVNAQAARPASVEPSRYESEEEYKRRRSAEILSEVEREFGVRLSGNEPELDWSGEVAFKASARALARAMARLRGNEDQGDRGDDMAKATRGPKQSRDTDLEKIKQEITKSVIAELGLGRSNAPRAVGGAGAPPTSEDYQKVLRAYNPSEGPRAALRRLKELRKEAEAR